MTIFNGIIKFIDAEKQCFSSEV